MTGAEMLAQVDADLATVTARREALLEARAALARAYALEGETPRAVEVVTRAQMARPTHGSAAVSESSILNLLRSGGAWKAPALAGRLGVKSTTQITTILKRLRAEGRVVTRGGGPTTCYALP